MPIVNTEGTTDEEIAEWLGRLEETFGDLPFEREAFETELRKDQYGLTTAEQGFQNQVDALWRNKDVTEAWDEFGIHALGVREAWGWHQRYYIEGLKGLWSWESALSFFTAGQEAE